MRIYESSTEILKESDSITAFMQYGSRIVRSAAKNSLLCAYEATILIT